MWRENEDEETAVSGVKAVMRKMMMTEMNWEVRCVEWNEEGEPQWNETRSVKMNQMKWKAWKWVKQMRGVKMSQMNEGCENESNEMKGVKMSEMNSEVWRWVKWNDRCGESE